MSTTVPRPDPQPVVAPAELGPPVAATQEVRFAVVMYGGVSLAIYINGVARELFRLVQATAPERRKGARSQFRADGTGAVYRKLGQLLEGGRLRTDLCELRGGAADGNVRPYVFIREDAGGAAAPIRTRFVVDILSGTSAGGINAVYLAKALANDGDFEVLRKLWLEEADIGLLIHDAGSHDSAFRTPAAPASVLNSNRMYYKLLDALRRVGAPGAEPSRLVEELDLFVTATDVRGLVVPVALSDSVIEERRHRNVFRFRYATKDAAGGRDHNDFSAANDAFLAFAARCTSAFPGAFEPMRLDDVKDALDSAASRDALTARDSWAGFHRDYAAGDFDGRAFQDGGSLDNKPFTHAVAALGTRRADVPVDRKLIYIEPVPERIEAAAAPAAKPDMVANVKAALLELPRYETVREDLERLQERNRTITRVAEMLRHREEDVRLRRVRAGSDGARLESTDWARRDLTGMIDDHGIAYGAYHRLRVATVLDDLAELVSRLADFAPGSAEQRGVRRVIEAWKDARFKTYLDGPDDTAETENAFLFRFDLAWWLRRFTFAQEKVSELLAADAAGMATSLRAHTEGAAIAARAAGFSAAARHAFDDTLRLIRHISNDAYVHLRAQGRALRSRSEQNPLRAHVPHLGITRAELRTLAALPAPRCDVAARALLERARPALDALADDLAAALGAAVRPAGDAVRYALGLIPRRPENGVLDDDDVARLRALTFEEIAPGRVAQSAAQLFYQDFEFYDLIAFPILHDASVGEGDVVDVVRVSPLDASHLVEDEDARRRKLAGTAVSNFGAFFERRWRENDMLWGRLDAAERLVCALVPDGGLTEDERAVRDALIEELHDVICAEEGVERTELVANLGRHDKPEADSTVDVVARTLRVLGDVLAGVASGRGKQGPVATWPRRGANALAFTAQATVRKRRERRLSLIIIGVCYGVAGLLLSQGLSGWRAPWLAGGSVMLGTAISGQLFLAGMRRALHGRPRALKRASISAALALGVAVLVAIVLLVML